MLIEKQVNEIMPVENNFVMTVDVDEDDFGNSSSEEELELNVGDDTELMEQSLLEQQSSSDDERVVEILPNPEVAKKRKISTNLLQEQFNRPEVQAMMLEMLSKTMAGEPQKKRKGKDKKSNKRGEVVAQGKAKLNKQPQIVQPIKSPSDTTVYRPALKQKQIDKINGQKELNGNEDVLKFIESLRLGEYPQDTHRRNNDPRTWHK